VKKPFSIFHLVLVIILSLYTSTKLYSQTEIRLQHFSTKDGLSQNTINFIFQDHKGFIWIGTHNGLNRFDGTSFTVYKNIETDKSSIQSNDNYAVYEDKKGQLWFGNGQGISLYNRSKDNFINFSYVKDDKHSMRPVWSVEASAEEGKIWLGASGGLFLFDTNKGSFSHFNIDDALPGANAVQELFLDSKKNLWLGTNGAGIYIFNNQNKKIRHYTKKTNLSTALSDNSITSIYEDSENQIWIGTENGVLNRFNEANTSFDKFQVASREATGIHSIIEDKSKKLWLGTDKGGLFQFDKKNSRFMAYSYKAEPGNHVIRSLFEDAKGNIWIGTYGGGIYLYDKLDNYFKQILPYQQVNNYNQSNSVLAISESANGNLWLGTDGGGLLKYQKESKNRTYFKKENSNSLPGNTVLSLHNAGDKKLYIGTFQDGLSVYDLQTQKFSNYRNNPANPNSLSDNTIWDIHEETNGSIWLATNNGGVAIFNPAKQTFKQLTYHIDNPKSLSSNSVRSIFKDSRNNIWVGTVSGLNLFNPQDSTFTHYYYSQANKQSLSNNSILCIYEDFNNNLWLGTHGGGLNKFNVQDGTFRHYKEKDGLLGNVVYGILEDEQGFLWLSTDKGLSKFNIGANQFQNFDESSGLFNAQFNIGAYYKNPQKEMFFGNINGLCSFNPQQIKKNYYVPPVVITGFQIFNQPVGIGINSPLTQNITETNTITVDYKQSVINFSFSALNYTHPQKNMYAYKLEPFEKDWNEVGYRQFATYTNLDPGEYTFLVKGSNNDGLWNEQPTKLKLIVRPPFWATWWFRGLGLLFLAGFIYGGYWYKTRSIKKQQAKLKKLVKIRTQEIKEKNALLIAAEKKNAELIQNQLNIEITHKSKELTRYTLLIIQKNRLLEDLKNKLREAVQNPKAINMQSFKEIIRTINANFSPDQEWREFTNNFERVHEDFVQTLKAYYPELTHNDLRLCALYRLDTSTKDIAKILGISETSVKMARYRLRKKLTLSAEEDLTYFLNNLPVKEKMLTN